MNPRESEKLNPIGVIYRPMVLAIPTHGKHMKWPKLKYVQVRNGFPTYSPWFSTSKISYAKNPRESKKLDPIAVFCRPLLLAISTHDINMKWPKEKSAQVRNGFLTYNPWFSTSKISYATNPKESKTLDRVAVFHGPPVFAITTYKNNMKCPKEKYVQVVNGFPTYNP